MKLMINSELDDMLMLMINSEFDQMLNTKSS